MYKRIKELRISRNLTQEDISALLEISPRLYSVYESGKKRIPISILSKIAKIYNTSIDFIVEDTDEMVPFN